MPSAGIDLASAADSQTLITTAAGEHFWVDDIDLIPSTAGEYELLSGSTVIWHSQISSTGGQYNPPPRNIYSLAVGDNLVLRRVEAMAMGGSIHYRVK